MRPRLILAGHTTPASARWEARANEAPLAGHVEITGYVDTARRIELFAERAHAGAAVVRRGLRPAGARSHGVRRAGGGVVARLAARSRRRRGDSRSIPTMPRDWRRGCGRCSTMRRPNRRRNAACCRRRSTAGRPVRRRRAGRTRRPWRSMRIAVDARELCGHPTGVGRYLGELLTEWAGRRRRHAPRVDPVRPRRSRSVAGRVAIARAGRRRQRRHVLGTMGVPARARRASGRTWCSRRRTRHR